MLIAAWGTGSETYQILHLWAQMIDFPSIHFLEHMRLVGQIHDGRTTLLAWLHVRISLEMIIRCLPSLFVALLKRGKIKQINSIVTLILRLCVSLTSSSVHVLGFLITKSTRFIDASVFLFIAVLPTVVDDVLLALPPNGFPSESIEPPPVLESAVWVPLPLTWYFFVFCGPA